MLRKFIYYLDYPVKFIFINSKGNVLLNQASSFEEEDADPSVKIPKDKQTNLAKAINETKQSKDIYETQIRRYFGLGFIFSFIPFTEAVTARRDYFASLLKLDTAWDESIKTNELSVLNHMPQTPFYLLAGFVNIIYRSLYSYPTFYIPRNIKVSFLTLLTHLPFVSDVIFMSHKVVGHRIEYSVEYRDDWYVNLIHSVLNPMRPISQFLRFLYFSVNSFFELGADNSKSSIPRMILKTLNAIIFMPLLLVSGIAEKAIDLVLITLDTLILDPLRFVYEVGKQIYDDYDKEFLYVPTDERKAVTTLNKILDEHEKKESEKESEYDLLDENKIKPAFDNKQHSLIKTTYAEKSKYKESLQFYNEAFKDSSLKNKEALKMMSKETKNTLYNLFTVFAKSHPVFKHNTENKADNKAENNNRSPNK